MKPTVKTVTPAIFYVLLIFYVLFGVGGAAAQEQCNKVLELAPLNNAEYYKSDFIYQLHQMSTTSKNDSSVGLSFDREITLTKGDLKFARSKSRSESVINEFQRKKIDYVKYYGQGELAKTWLECLRRNGDIEVSFRPESDRHVTLVIAYYKATGNNPAIQPPLRLQAPVRLPSPDAHFEGDTACLQAGYEFQPGSECRVTVDVASAWTTINIAANFSRQDGTIFGRSAFLPPRARIRWEVKDWDKRISARTLGAGYIDQFKFEADSGFTIGENIHVEKLSCIPTSPECGPEPAKLSDTHKVAYLGFTTASRRSGRESVDPIGGEGRAWGVQFRAYWDPPMPR